MSSSWLASRRAKNASEKSTSSTTSSIDTVKSINQLPEVSRGILSIKIIEARGLNVSTEILERVNGANASFDSNRSMSSALNKTPRRRESMQRQLFSHLPYVLLTFDRNEVVIDALSGEINGPISYLYQTSFDVSRSTSVGIGAYLRTESVNATSDSDVIDYFMASTTIEPNFDPRKPIDSWFKAENGNLLAEFRVQISYKAASNQESLSINDFELLKVIGKGSFGKVMQVRKKNTGRIYALKTIRKAHIISRSEVTHTLAERTVLAQVTSPFIVPLKFSFQSPEKLYLVLAYVNGGELFHHLQKEGRFSETRSRLYAAELLCALDHLHGFDIIYRDLKPENILISYTGHLLLCDFGLCKLNMSQTEHTNTFAGTPEYLAPELILGIRYTRVVDWWTLGILLYEMLTGLPPFYEDDHQKMYKRIVHETLTFPLQLQGEAREILTGLLQKDPSKRIGSQGANEIRRHRFFKDLDWSKVEKREIEPRFRPSVQNAVDCSNVDLEFLSEQAADSLVEDSKLSQSIQDQFTGFTYEAPTMLMGSMRL